MNIRDFMIPLTDGYSTHKSDYGYILIKDNYIVIFRIYNSIFSDYYMTKVSLNNKYLEDSFIEKVYNYIDVKPSKEIRCKEIGKFGRTDLEVEYMTMSMVKKDEVLTHIHIDDKQKLLNIFKKYRTYKINKLLDI